MAFEDHYIFIRYVPEPDITLQDVAYLVGVIGNCAMSEGGWISRPKFAGWPGNVKRHFVIEGEKNSGVDS